MPAVRKAMDKVVTRRTRRQNGNSNNTAEIEYNEVKPLIIKEPLPSVSPKVEMEVLKLKLVIPVERIQKARRGLPFNPGSCCTIPFPVIMLIHVVHLNSTELHPQGVAPRLQYGDPMPEAVTLQ